MLTEDETLFTNEEVFEPDHVPEEFLHRSNQLHALASFLKPAIRGSRPVNAVIHGLPATGKTTAVKKVFYELQENTSKVECIHINCRLYSSTYAVFCRIYEQLFNKQAPETGTAMSSLFDKIVRKLNKPLVVALDDIKMNKHANDTIYNILRIYETKPEIKTGVWLIMQNNKIDFDSRVKSIFSPEFVKFPVYSEKEIYEILLNRVRSGLFPGVFPLKLLRKIADYAYCKNDLRFGIETIRQTVLKAEPGCKRITEKHLNLPELSLEEKLIASLDKPKTSGELYDSFQDGLSYSAFDRKLRKLEKKKLIKTSICKKGQGQSRIIKRWEVD
jgi:cell division control protein 6